jgi:small-conductance mechanosensitive channel
MNELESIDDATQLASSTVADLLHDLVAHTPFLAGALIVILFTWGLGALVERLTPRLLGRWNRRASLKQLITRLVSISVWILGLLLAAVILFPGVTPAKALGGLGVVSLAVGLAFKDIFENFFAGILLLLRFPFENGDYIECEGIVGQVEKVLFRMTYLRRTSGELVVVPNAFLFKNPVEILTEKPLRRVTLMTGVSYDTAVDDAIVLLEKTLKSCDSVDPDKPIQVFAKAYGSSSIDIEITWWTASRPVDVRRSRSEVIVATKRALDEAGMEIPFPHRTLTFKDPVPLQ